MYLLKLGKKENNQRSSVRVQRCFRISNVLEIVKKGHR